MLRHILIAFGLIAFGAPVVVSMVWTNVAQLMGRINRVPPLVMLLDLIGVLFSLSILLLGTWRRG